MTTHRVSVPRLYYGLVKPLIEADALALKQRRPWLHLAECCQRVLQRKPTAWRVYREAIKLGCASEFQKPKRLPSRLSPVDRVWFQIEAMARTLISASESALTLRTAVLRLVEVQPELLARYSAAIRRTRRARDLGAGKGVVRRG